MIVAAFALLMATGCNGQNNNNAETRRGTSLQNEQTSNSGNMSKSIVIFFSHAGDNYSVGVIDTGNTKIVADYISEITGADQFEIVTHKYDGMAYTPLIELAKKEAAAGELPPYEGTAPDLSGYDTVFIGGPVWWGTYPQVMFTLFKDINLDGKTVIPFTTHERQRRAQSLPEGQGHGRVQHLRSRGARRQGEGGEVAEEPVEAVWHIH